MLLFNRQQLNYTRKQGKQTHEVVVIKDFGRMYFISFFEGIIENYVFFSTALFLCVV